MEPKIIDKIYGLAQEAGFDCIGTCPASELKVRPEVRDMCAADKCQAYGKNWVCPPACGSIESFQAEYDKRDSVIVLQSVGQMEDDYDYEVIMETAQVHNDRFHEFVKSYRESELNDDPALDPLFLGAGACDNCSACTYPDVPCRFPDLQFSSMEASGLVVADVCTSAGIPYNHGPNTIAYSACVVL